jgi:hypothetical protein
MNNTYEQKYLKYKSKYMNLKINGGAFKKKAEERKAKEMKQQADAERIRKVLEAWEKITQTMMFIADVEMLVTMGDKSNEEAIEIIKNKIKTDEETKQRYYMINSIKESMDFLGLKPVTELEEQMEVSEVSDEFF